MTFVLVWLKIFQGSLKFQWLFPFHINDFSTDDITIDNDFQIITGFINCRWLKFNKMGVLAKHNIVNYCRLFKVWNLQCNVNFIVTHSPINRQSNSCSVIWKILNIFLRLRIWCVCEDQLQQYQGYFHKNCVLVTFDAVSDIEFQLGRWCKIEFWMIFNWRWIVKWRL